MQTQNLPVYPELQVTIEKAREQSISDERLAVLKPLIEYIQTKIDQGKEVQPQLYLHP